MSVSYAADVMPVHLRQYLTTYVNLCWVIGQIIASGVLRGLVGNDTQWAYRVSDLPQPKEPRLTLAMLLDPIRNSMDLAPSYHHRHRLCA